MLNRCTEGALIYFFASFFNDALLYIHKEGESVANSKENGLGKVEISESVIAVIAGTAASECYGLVGMASRNVQDGIAELLGWENLERGVHVTLHDGAVEIELHIMVEYGVKISEVAHNVMEQVKYAVENTCGLEVRQVNVHVEGVRVRNGSRHPRR